MTEKYTNRLAQETSPYLLQHADNPVAWYPWDQSALDAAREQDKPILLSIGYSACHWCHVMAHESFEDEETAGVMNELFINIKVDREERPDLDKVYQIAQMLITQRSGGWPLTMFLLPQDQTPFFGGTYFPKEQRHGLPPFKDVLRRVHEYYHANKHELSTQKQTLQQALNDIFSSSQTGAMPAARQLARQAVATLEKLFDARHGGFGNEPKFPNCHYIDLLFRYTSHGEEDRRALHMALFTLEKICRGGIHDQLGGGFCRYAVDEKWMIPHFEKMLYDNAGLLGLLAQAWCVSGNDMFLESACDTAGWVMREMQSPEGGYYSALDADSEGVEGKYYVWKQEKAREILGKDYPIFAARFGLDDIPNFEGQWHFFQKRTVAELADMFSSTEDDIRKTLHRGYAVLLKQREARVRPARDDKVLTSWNALIIKNMMRAARLLNKPEYAASALKALQFIRQTMWRDNHLLASWKDGKAKLNAYLDDYAFLIGAIIETCQTRWNADHFTFACQLADTMIEQFEDSENGGFFFTSHDHETLLQRPRILADEATPSGYGNAALVLLALGNILGNEKYLQTAERAIAQAGGAIARSPENHASLLNAALERDGASETLIIRGEVAECEQWLAETSRHYNPLRICLAIPSDETLTIRGLADKVPHEVTCAYPCRGVACLEPIKDFATLQKHLRGSAVSIKP